MNDEVIIVVHYLQFFFFKSDYNFQKCKLIPLNMVF